MSLAQREQLTLAAAAAGLVGLFLQTQQAALAALAS